MLISSPRQWWPGMPQHYFRRGYNLRCITKTQPKLIISCETRPLQTVCSTGPFTLHVLSLNFPLICILEINTLHWWSYWLWSLLIDSQIFAEHWHYTRVLWMLAAPNGSQRKQTTWISKHHTHTQSSIFGHTCKYKNKNIIEGSNVWKQHTNDS